MIDWEVIQDKILSMVSIEDIINKYTCNKIVRNRTECFCCSGNQHNTLSLQKGYAYCFRCGRNFNQIQAVMKLQKCNYGTACKMIIADFGLPIEVDRPLTSSEKKEWAKRQREKEREQLKAKNLKDFERKTANKIIAKLRKCESCKNEVDKLPLARKVEAMDNIVQVDFEIERLDWLYNTVCGLMRNYNCEYEYIYPTDRKELLRAIYRGEINI